MRPIPKCFCKVPVPNCPTCTKVNWNNVRPSNGDAHKAKTLAARIAVGAAASLVILVTQANAQCVIVGKGAHIIAACPRATLTPAQAADLLRPGAWKPSAPEVVTQDRRVLVPATFDVPATSTPMPATESEGARAIRMGIPGGWTPLEWAILHSTR